MLRKIAQNDFNKRASEKYIPYQDLESMALLVDILENPQNFLSHIRRVTYSSTSQLVLNFRTPKSDDPKLMQLYQVSMYYFAPYNI